MSKWANGHLPISHIYTPPSRNVVVRMPPGGFGSAQRDSGAYSPSWSAEGYQTRQQMAESIQTIQPQMLIQALDFNLQLIQESTHILKVVGARQILNQRGRFLNSDGPKVRA